MTDGDRDTPRVALTVRSTMRLSPLRWLRCMLGGLALIAGLQVAAPAVAAEPQVDGDAAPGTLLAHTPLQFGGRTSPIAGTAAWRVEYTSTSAQGATRTISGSVLVDAARPGGPRGLVGMAPGGHGLADKCAPSNQLRAGTEPDIDTINALLSAGYIVALTDYEGMGMPGAHTFGVNLAGGRNVIDIVRAAKQLTVSGAGDPQLPVGLYGYSQGGGAVGSAIEQLPTYAPELHVSGASIGGVLAFPGVVARGVDGTVWGGLTSAALLGFDAAYDLGLYGDLTRWGRHLMSDAKRNCMNGLMVPLMFNRLEWILKRRVLSQPRWRQAAEDNSLGRQPASVPVYQYHGVFDQIMSYRDARKLRVLWCEQGSTVRFERSLATEHFFTEAAMRTRAVRWLGQRMEGRPDRGNC